MNQPNKVQIEVIKRMIKKGKIPNNSKILTKEHEIYCYLPVTDNKRIIIAVHSSGKVTEHIRQ